MKKTMKLTSRVDGLGIAVLVVEPNTAPRAVLQLSHGVCGRKERYLPFMEFMAERGVACVAGDHRGHGESVKSK